MRLSKSFIGVIAYHMVIFVLGLIGAILFSVWLFREGYGYSAFRHGSWVGWPVAGLEKGNLFADAAQWFSGPIGIGGSEGLLFKASRDQEGRRLNSQCTYRVTGGRLLAQWWSLVVEDDEGGYMHTPSMRVGFTTGDVLRRQDGSFELTVSYKPQSGNWLPLEKNKNFALVLRLYDASYTRYVEDENNVLPLIVRGQCQ